MVLLEPPGDGLAVSGQQSVVLGRAAPEVTDYLDLHRGQVALRCRSLFLNLDKQVQRIIGYHGSLSILEEIYQRKPAHLQDGSINTNGLDPHLQPYIHNSSFYFQMPLADGLYIKYFIECPRGGFRPSIMVPTQDGFLEFMVLAGPEGSEFQRVRITRHFRQGEKREPNLYNHRIIGTFENNKENGLPDYPLVKTETLSERSIKMHYGGIDASGNVELLDGETVFITGADSFYGIYHKPERKIEWKSISGASFEAPQVTEEGNILTIEYGSDKFKFPIKTNIYKEIKEITTGISQLPIGETSALMVA